LHYKFLLRICIHTLKRKFAKRFEKSSIHPPLLNLGQIIALTSSLKTVSFLKCSIQHKDENRESIQQKNQ